MDTLDVSPIHSLARAAINCLRQADGRRAEIALPNGDVAALTYKGPSLPEFIPDSIADYEMVRTQPPGWSASHRLTLTCPLVVYDLCWNEDEPLRILTFCRGDWEQSFMEAVI